MTSTSLHDKYSNHYCIVRECKNTSVKTPGKLWIKAPAVMRNTWLKLAKKDPNSLSSETKVYFCEDHFDLENDMENYMQYKIMGSVKKIRMKPNCIPTRFDNQSERKRKLTSTPDGQHDSKKAAVIPLSESVKLIHPIEMSTSFFHQGFGECCCFCEAQGRHTSMISDRVLRGEEDNYLAMLLECYNISLSTGDAGSALICASCACRLRDALAFRQLVLRAQTLLQAANTVQVEVTHTAADMDIDIKLELEDSESSEPPDPCKAPEPPDTSGSLEPTTTSKASIPILVKPDPDIDIFEHWFIKPGSNPGEKLC